MDAACIQLAYSVHFACRQRAVGFSSNDVHRHACMDLCVDMCRAMCTDTSIHMGAGFIDMCVGFSSNDVSCELVAQRRYPCRNA